jgi:hypothetical protein
VTKYGEGGVKSVLGSGAWTNSPRAVLMMGNDSAVPWHEDNRTLTVVKSNRGKRGETKRYFIERVEVDGVKDLVPKLVSRTWPTDQP